MSNSDLWSESWLRWPINIEWQVDLRFGKFVDVGRWDKLKLTEAQVSPGPQLQTTTTSLVVETTGIPRSKQLTPTDPETSPPPLNYRRSSCNEALPALFILKAALLHRLNITATRNLPADLFFIDCQDTTMMSLPPLHESSAKDSDVGHEDSREIKMKLLKSPTQETATEESIAELELVQGWDHLTIFSL
ncbi:hypothetical protein BU16DRAFT_557435 [Lophium mytilinum]|uniref:Uncharacterized protein n=1 Tax=Lophium mytilinum TaxID=390894 RepID=A0A6A6R2Y8_9PEZI|nr:hypothetical protein BU16DRAFT_557435 [Lophium mytilinum]